MPDYHDQLFVLARDLGFGGMQTLKFQLAEQYAARGGKVTFLSSGGPAIARAERIGHVEIFDWSPQRMVDNYQRVQTIVSSSRGAAAMVTQVDPLTFYLVPMLAMSLPSHICVHNRPRSFDFWLSESLNRRVQTLLGALHKDRLIGISAASAEHASFYDEWFGLEPGSVAPWLAGVDWCEQSHPRAGPEIRRIDVVTRLSPEKHIFIDAAIELVHAARSVNDNPILMIWGEGSTFEEISEKCHQALGPDGYVMCGPTDRPLHAIQEADLVVNAGVSAIEALVSYRRVISVVTSRPDHPLGELVTIENADRLRTTNFAGDGPMHAPAAIWDSAKRMGIDEVTRLGNWARGHFQVENFYNVHRSIIADTRWSRVVAARNTIGEFLAADVEAAYKTALAEG